MIDNYPNNRNDYDAGFAAAVSELRNIREQQENLYFRDEALKSGSIPRKSSRKKNVQQVDVHYNPKLDDIVASLAPNPKDSTQDLCGFIVLMLFSAMVAASLFLIHLAFS